jgi:hypothetical protein
MSPQLVQATIADQAHASPWHFADAPETQRLFREIARAPKFDTRSKARILRSVQSKAETPASYLQQSYRSALVGLGRHEIRARVYLKRQYSNSIEGLGTYHRTLIMRCTTRDARPSEARMAPTFDTNAHQFSVIIVSIAKGSTYLPS